MYLISVVVPVYNVEKYLDRCITSIVNQSYKDLEVILIDDGSTDLSGKICDQWKKKDKRIKVIHKQNGGLSDARNVGVSLARGEYIGFIDSDDWIAPTMYEKLLNTMLTNSADIASCGVLKIWDNDQTCMLTKKLGNCSLNTIEAMEALIDSTYLIQTVWNKLYRKSVIGDLTFRVGMIHEDEFWTWKAIAQSTKIVTIEEPLYYYFQRVGSIMGSGNTGHTINFINAKYERHAYIQENMPSLVNKSCSDILFSCLFVGEQAIKYYNKSKKVITLQKLAKTTNMYYPEKDYIKTLHIKQRIYLFSIHKFFIAMCYLYYFVGKMR